MNATTLTAILQRHEIHPQFWTEFRALILCGTRPSKELRTRLDYVANYKAALDEALAELSKPLRHTIPPSISFKSLTPEEVCLPTT